MKKRSFGVRALAVAMIAIASAFATIPSGAFAAPGALLDRVDLQFDPGTTGHDPILIITGTLAESADLPAVVRLPIPQGMAVRWAGEVLGGALEDDPTLQPAIEHGENGYDIAVLTLSAGRRGQIELDAPGLVSQDGTSRFLRMAWLPADAVGTVGLTTAVPAGATISTVTPGATTGPGPSNGTLISLETSAAVGVEAVLEVAYELSAAPPVASPQTSDTAGVLIFAAIAVLFVVIGFSIVRRTRNRETAAAATTAHDGDAADTHDDAPAAEADHAPVDPLPAPDTPADRTPSSPARRFPPQVIILLAVAVVLGAAVVLMSSGEAPGTSRTTDEYAYRVLTAADADATATFRIALSEADPAHESVHVFDAVAGVAGVRSVKVVFAGPSVEVEYDSSVVDEGTIGAALAAGGYPAD